MMLAMMLSTTTAPATHAQVLFAPQVNGDVNAVIVAPGGGVLIGGEFSSVNGQSRGGLARLHADGSLDADFLPPVFSGRVDALGLTPDGGILVGGDFETVGGPTRWHLVRLRDDGSVDSDFQADLDDGVRRLAVQPDGKVLVAGRFDQVDGSARRFLARLSDDGGLDAGFADPQLEGEVEAIVLQPDGRILIGGWFDEVHGQPRAAVARLTSNGGLDTGFADPQILGQVETLALQADGRILVGGAFGEVGDAVRPYIARLNINGSLDQGFVDAGLRYGGKVRQIRPLLDGRIVVSGDWSWVGDASGSARVAVLFENGLRDTGVPEMLMDSYAMALAMEAGGRMLVGGFFNLPRPNLFAIQPPAAASQDELEASGSTVTWWRSGYVPLLASTPVLEASDDGIDFVPVGAMDAVAHGWQLGGYSPPGGAAAQHLRARAMLEDGGMVEVRWLASLRIFGNGFE